MRTLIGTVVLVLLAASSAFPIPPHHWSKRFGSTAQDGAHDVALDPAGNAAITGMFMGFVDFGNGLISGSTDMFVAKYSPSGAPLWSRHAPAVSEDIAMDAVGSVVVTGWCIEPVDFGGGLLSGSGDAAFIVKYSANGTHLWSKRLNALNGGVARGLGIATDAAQNILVTGYFSETIDLGGQLLHSSGGFDVFVAKYDPNGTQLWSVRFGNVQQDQGTCLTVDPSGDVVVAGHANRATIIYPGMFVTKFRGGNGALVWSRHPSSDIWAEFLEGVTTDRNGNVVFTGFFRNTINLGGSDYTSTGSYDIFLAKYTPDGDHSWSKRFGGFEDDRAYSVATDAGGNIGLTGEFSDVVDLGGGMLVSKGRDDVFLAMYTPDGAHQSSRAFGQVFVEKASNTGTGVCFDASGNVVLAGWFGGTVDFGGGPLTSPGSYDVFLVKFGQSPVSVTTPASRNVLEQNHPNPFNPSTIISFTLAERTMTAIAVYDVTGKLVVRLDPKVRDAGTHHVEWQGRDAAGRAAASGVYYYRLEGVADVAPRRMVLLK